MTPYGIELTTQANRDINRLDAAARTRILTRIRFLSGQVQSHHHHALKGRWRGTYRLRVGDYRVIYGIDHASRLITILRIEHRSSIYD